MLEAEDLRQIGKLLEASEKCTKENIQKAISASEERMIKRMDERMDERLNERFAAFEKRMDERMDKRMNEHFAAFEKRMDERLEKRITHSESMLLDEMERYDQKNEQRFRKIEREIEGLKDICRIANLESGNFEILSRTVQDHDRRLTALEAQMA